MKRILLSALFTIIIGFGLNAQTEFEKAQNYLQQKGEVYFTFSVESPLILLNLTRDISIDRVDGLEVKAYANSKEFTKFLDYNLDYTILTHPGELIQEPDMWDESKGIWEFDTYPTYSQFLTMMNTFVTNYPNLCKLHQIGTTVDGRQYLFLQISDNVNTREAEPRFMWTGSMHGDETTGYILCLHMIDYLLDNYGTNTDVTNIINNTELWIMPLENPDGTYAGGDNTVSGSVRYNSNNVDLNRNYKNQLDGDHPDGEAWQPETMAMMGLLDTLHFVMSANFHGGAEVVNFPWDSWVSTSNPHADNDWFYFISREYADEVHLHAPAAYMDYLDNGVTHGGDWYVVTGSRQDYMTWYNRGREVCLEVSDTKTIPASELLNHWNYNYPSMIKYMKQVQYGIRGIITDACTGQPIVANISITGHDQTNDQSDQYSELPLGDYYRPIEAGTYSVVYSAPGYVSQTFSVTAANYATTTRNVALQPAAPVSDFEADETSTCSGTVNFSCLTTGVTTWSWNFGDGQTSTLQNPSHTYTASGTYTVTLTVTNCGGLGTDTEAKTAYITVDLATAPTTTGGNRCGSGTVNLSASGSGTLNWYAGPTGGTVLTTGSTYSPSVSATTTYYVEDVVSSPAVTYNVGETMSSSNGAYRNGYYYLIFDCTTPFVLKSVEINSQTAGVTHTIQLQNSSGTMIQTIDVTAATAGVSRVDLNFNVPVGTDLRLANTSSTYLYRNNTTLSYPYEVPGVVSIKTTNASPNPTTYYYYFFDWEIEVPGETCSSPRTPVTATVYTGPTLAMTSTAESTPGANNGTATATPTGSSPYTYIWNDPAPVQTTQTANGLAAGTYCCTVTDSHGCSSSSCVTVAVGASPLNASVSASTNVACYGVCTGTATAAASGGTSPYSYNWGSGITTQTASNLCAGTYIVTVTDNVGSTSTASVTITQPASAVNGTTSSVAVSCFGGSNGQVSVTGSGGTSPYTYLWTGGSTSTTVTGLSAGTYTVTITDFRGCTTTKTATVTQPASALAGTSTGSAVDCFGDADGQVSVTATGGTPTYSYLWAPGGATTATVTGLVANTYTVTITDANGCTLTRTANITQPSVLSATNSTTPDNCGHHNGTVTLTVSGGTPTYSYLWSPAGSGASLSGLAAGSYTCTITDSHGCTSSNTAIVATTGSVTAAFTYSTNQCLDGNSFTFTNTGTSGVTYSWNFGDGTGVSSLQSPSYSYSTPGSFTVTQNVVDGTCTDTETHTVSVYPMPVVSTSAINSTCGNNDGSATAIVAGGTSPYTYNWTGGGSSSTVSGLSSGTYFVTVTDSHSCTDIASVAINDIGGPSIALSGTDASCYGYNDGSATVNVTGGTSPFTYLWSDGSGTSSASGLLAGDYSCQVEDASGCITSQSITISEPTQITTSFTTTGSTCGNSDGAATVVASGGSGTYSYNWSTGSTTTGITSVAAGTYFITVTDDNDCSSISSVVINDLGAPVVSFTSNNVTCNGGVNGSAAAFASGGTAPYSYNWSNSSTSQILVNLAAGVYTVTVSDGNGCETVESVEILQPEQIIISGSVTDAGCLTNDGSIVLSVTGGVPGYNYDWFTGESTSTISGLGSGEYMVTVTDASGCNEMTSFYVANSDGPVIEYSQVDLLCYGEYTGVLAVNASGGTGPYTYLWSIGSGSTLLTGLNAGIYTLTVTDATGCSQIESFELTSPSQIVVTPGVTNETSYGAGNGSIDLMVSGGVAPYTYLWSNGAETEDITGLTTGSYTVTVTDANGCEHELVVPVTYETSINENTGLAVKLYPNPATGYVIIESGIEIEYISVLNILGENILEVKDSGKSIIINTEQIEAGVYLVRIKSGGASVTRQLIISK